jgi:basic membrane protein A and related proteins
MIGLAPLNPVVPEDMATEVAASEAAMKGGTLHPFQGPLKNQSGEVVVPEGTTLSDAELLKLECYVEGVQGQLPQ